MYTLCGPAALELHFYKLGYFLSDALDNITLPF